MRRKPAPYHTGRGEVERLRAIMVEYKDFPECVANAQRTLDAFRAAHPEIVAVYPSSGKVA